MAEGNGAQGACSRGRNCTLAAGNRTRNAGSRRRYCAVRICNNGVGVRGLLTEAICAALLGRLATGTRASCETNGGAPDRAGGGRAGCVVPPSSCHFPVRKELGWRAFGFALGLWATPRRFARVGAGAEDMRGWDTTMMGRRVWVTEIGVATV